MGLRGRVAFYIIGVFLAASGFLIYGYSPYLVSSGAELLPTIAPTGLVCKQSIEGAVTTNIHDPESRILVSVTAPLQETLVEETVFAHNGRYMIPVEGTPKPEAVWQIEVIQYGAVGRLGQRAQEISGVACNDAIELDVSV